MTFNVNRIAHAVALGLIINSLCSHAQQPCNPHCYADTLSGIANLHWPAGTIVHYEINDSMGIGNTSQQDWQNAIDAAFSEWVTNGGSAFQVTFDSTTAHNWYPGADTLGDGYNTIGWYFARDFNNSAITYVFFTRPGGINECDTWFNHDSTISWSTNPGPTDIDIQSICTHEFGHWLHLDDERSPCPYSNVMDTPYVAGTTSHRQISQDD